MDKPLLTQENYYDDNYYMSTSRFKNYITCESRALAIDNGIWEENSDVPKALILGNYVHTAFESDLVHQAFIEEHRGLIFKKNGLKYADFILADDCIETLRNDTYFMEQYNGSQGDRVEKELIVTGNLGGLDFKGKVDSINLTKGYFVDLKTMRSIKQETFSPMLRQRVPQVVFNIYEYLYHVQAYVYQQLLFQQEVDHFTPYIAAVSKEEYPDKEYIVLDDAVLDEGKQIFETHIERVRQVFKGEVIPKPCGEYDYCRHEKILYKPVTLADIVLKND